MLSNSQLLYLLFISGFSRASLGSPEFHLIETTKSYEDAKTYCREMYSDLATIDNLTVMNNLIDTVSDNISRAWIGLEIADNRTWHWSLPGHKVDYTNWSEGNPQENDQDACGAMDESGKWFESNCTEKRSFVCQGVSGSHVFVALTRSWRNAQNHCRGLSTELVRILSPEENEAVRELSQNSWIGLYKDPWRWSDGSLSSFRFWAYSQPNYVEGQDCTAIVFKNSNKWNDLRCTVKRKFICQGAYKAPTTTIQTTTPISTSVTNLSTVSNITSESIVVTFHFTVATNETNPTTTPSATSALTTVPVTTERSTIQSVTMAPHSDTSGKLVLIKLNLTWIEAIIYCRRHYIDLVHIPTEAVQRKVTEKLKHATTAHVWIGLKYTCSSKVWFWTKSTAGCYQNWAPHQGSERNYSCGVTGAVEATGGQQWVGLPQTERLNFICHSCTT